MEVAAVPTWSPYLILILVYMFSNVPSYTAAQACTTVQLNSSAQVVNIGSPGFDYITAYGNNLDLCWLLTLDSAYVSNFMVKLTVTYANLGSTCAGDYVNVREGDSSTGTLIKTICGVQGLNGVVSLTYYSCGSTMYVRMVTDGSGGSTGWAGQVAMESKLSGTSCSVEDAYWNTIRSILQGIGSGLGGVFGSWGNMFTWAMTIGLLMTCAGAMSLPCIIGFIIVMHVRGNLDHYTEDPDQPLKLPVPPPEGIKVEEEVHIDDGGNVPPNEVLTDNNQGQGPQLPTYNELYLSNQRKEGPSAVQVTEGHEVKVEVTTTVQ